MLVSFVKYEGAGNDFILIDDREELFSADARLIAALCDRHFGIGADGLMTLRRSVEMDCSMRYYNADGSPGEMCGNGARCFALFAEHLVFCYNLENHLEDRPSGWIGLHRNTAIMHSYNFADQGKSQPYSTQLPASGFIHPEKRFEHALLKFLRDSGSRILH